MLDPGARAVLHAAAPAGGAPVLSHATALGFQGKHGMWWWIRNEDEETWRKHQALSAVGIEMAISPLIGWGLGAALDSWLSWPVRLSVIGLVVGAIAGFRALYRATRKVQQELDAP